MVCVVWRGAAEQQAADARDVACNLRRRTESGRSALAVTVAARQGSVKQIAYSWADNSSAAGEHDRTGIG